jgi:hypothetical protein
MIGYGTSYVITIDTSAILNMPANREQALRTREAIRLFLRTFEDVYDLPFSFEVKRPKPEDR